MRRFRTAFLLLPAACFLAPEALAAPPAGAGGKIAFRYMPDADNPEVFVEVAGMLTDSDFTGTADGKPLRLPRLQVSGAAIPACG